MEIVEVDPNILKAAEYNPRKLTEKQVKDLTESIREFGLVDPIIVNNHPERQNVVVGGHQRLKIAILEGFKTIPVVYVDLDEKRERELNLRLNKNLGEWDWDMLANFDEAELLKAGFDTQDLDRLKGLEEDIFDADKEYEEIDRPQTKLGDLYILGNHRLLCGDSTKRESFERLMGNEKCDLIVTDPPYNTGMQEKKDKKMRLSYMFDDNLSEEEYLILIKKSFENLFNFSKNNCVFYIFIDWRKMGSIKKEIEEKLKVNNVIVWDKIIHGLGSDYKFTYEMIIVGKKGKPKIKNRFDLDYQDIWRVQRKIGRNKDHSTSKPVEILEKAIKHASERKNIVLDAFGGSGSTMIACEQLDRRCFAIELDPKFVDVAIKRWELFTGKKAEKVV